MSSDSTLSDVESQASQGWPWKWHWYARKHQTLLGRCLPFFWLGFTFDTAGVVLMLAGVFTTEHYWDVLLYVGGGLYFLSLLWWVCWFNGNIELGVDDVAAASAVAAVAAAAAEATGYPDPSINVSSDFEDLVDSISRSLAFQRGSGSFTTTVSGSYSGLTLEFSASSHTRGGMGWISPLRLLSQGLGSWIVKHLCIHRSRVAVQPQEQAPQAPPKQVPSPGRPHAGRRLVSTQVLHRRPWSTEKSTSMPMLSTACPQCILPAHGHSWPWLPQLLTGSSLQASQSYPPRSPLQGHPPTVQSPALACPAGSHPVRPSSLQPHLETTMYEPLPSVCHTAGDHVNAPVIHRSSSEGANLRKIVVQPRAPVQEPQRPGSLGPKAGESRISHPGSVEIVDESP